jgi:Tol biopolymer transport system component/DNA-binding winged helix-turn-helix (wHTH) protein
LTGPQSKTRLAFGPFEVNPPSGELFKHGVRVRLSKQPFQVLLALLAQPGELVTREQLLAELWGDGTFVDFEHGLNAAINRLRQSLGDSAEKPRYIETVPGRGYRFIGTLELRDSAPVLSAVSPPIREEPPATRSPKRWWPLAAALVGVVVLAAWWRSENSQSTPASGKLTRLTNDPGLSDTSAISPDGKLVAYSADNGMDSGQNLYVKQVAGGPPIRLTFDGLGNTTPDFSPDGSHIVFRSERSGGGVYEIPAFGGEARLLAKNGLSPRYSPDGSQVAFWVGAVHISSAVPGSGAVWVVPEAGGQPRQVGLDFAAARYPVWAPDGKRLLIIGYNSQRAYDASSSDWWVISTVGGHPIRTGLRNELVRAGQGRLASSAFPAAEVPIPRCWSAATNSVIFSMENSAADIWNLWEGGLSVETGKVTGGFNRISTGSGNETNASCSAAGTVAFTNLEVRRDIWSLAFDLDQGRSTGALTRVTQAFARRDSLSLSSDGRSVAFASNQSGRLNIWMRELETGTESPAASSAFLQRFPEFSPSGDRIAFSGEEDEKRFVYVSAPGGVPEKVCEGCLRATDWSRDESKLLIFTGDPYQVNVLDIASRKQTPLLKHPAHSLLYGRFSPDNRWVSFTVRVDPNHAEIAIAPVEGPKPVPESAWIKIAEEQPVDWANWSPDGKTLYFTSARDGHTCIWAQRIDSVSHKPEGEAFAVLHFHGRASYEQGGWSVAGGRIAIVLNEGTGNIWMMSRPGGLKR